MGHSTIALHLWSALASEPSADPFVLQWDDPVGCADAAAVLSRVRTIVGDELARGELRRPVTAHGTVRAIPRGLELTLDVVPGLQRRIEAPDCAGIVEAAALVLATSASPEPPAPPTAAAPVCPACVCAPASCPVPPPAPAPIVTPAPARPRDRAVIGADAVLGVAVLDALAPGIVGRLGWSRGQLRLELGVRHLFAQTIARPEADAGARVSATTAELRGCWAPAVGRTSFPICLGVAAGAMQGRGVGGLSTTAVARRFTLATAPGLGVRVAIVPRLAMAADAALWVPIVRPGFRLEGDDGELFRAPAVGSVFSLGLEARLP